MNPESEHYQDPSLDWILNPDDFNPLPQVWLEYAQIAYNGDYSEHFSTISDLYPEDSLDDDFDSHYH